MRHEWPNPDTPDSPALWVDDESTNASPESLRAEVLLLAAARDDCGAQLGRQLDYVRQARTLVDRLLNVYGIRETDGVTPYGDYILERATAMREENVELRKVLTRSGDIRRAVPVLKQAIEDAEARVVELEGVLADQGRVLFLHGPAGTHDEQAVRAMRAHGHREARLVALRKTLADLVAAEDGFQSLPPEVALSPTRAYFSTLTAAIEAARILLKE